MKQAGVLFWNLGNLFDTNASDLASDSEFTPKFGWTEQVMEAKMNNIVKGIGSSFSNGPDLIGLCEIENETLAQKVSFRLNKLLNREDLQVAKYNDSPDIRGIDTCLIFSNKLFQHVESKSYNIDMRYPTRDIFVNKFRVLDNNTDLYVIVNHWPSRRGKDEFTESDDTEFARCLVSENCGKIIDNILKVPIEESRTYPDLITDKKEILTKIEDKWNQNILIMGDFNDEPFNKSMIKYLNASSNAELMRGWEKIFQLTRLDYADKRTQKQQYIEEKAPVYNYMWNLIPNGSHYFYKTKSLFLFDQFIASKGLYNNFNKLRIDPESVEVYKTQLSIGDLPGNSDDLFSETDPKKTHPHLKMSPMSFEYQEFKFIDGELKPDKFSITPGRQPNTGYSDHFPIKCIMEIH